MRSDIDDAALQAGGIAILIWSVTLPFVTSVVLLVHLYGFSAAAVSLYAYAVGWIPVFGITTGIVRRRKRTEKAWDLLEAEAGQRYRERLKELREGLK